MGSLIVACGFAALLVGALGIAVHLRSMADLAVQIDGKTVNLGIASNPEYRSDVQTVWIEAGLSALSLVVLGVVEWRRRRSGKRGGVAADDCGEKMVKGSAEEARA